MDTPTKEKPAIDVVGGVIRVMRGYEVVDRRRSGSIFLGAHDGPLLEIKPPTGTPMLIALEGAIEIARAILKAAEVPTSPEEPAHAEIRALGYEPISR